MGHRLLFAAAVAWPFVCAVVTWAGEAVVLVAEGQPRAVIRVAADADKQTREAAKLLAEHVRLSTGAELPVKNGDIAAAVTVHVGSDAYVKRLGLRLKELDEDGFVIRAEAGHVAIAGPTPWGTEFGVCEFLERTLGVRWLMPGPDGTDVPAHRTLAVPLGEVRGEPAFFSRLFSGLAGSEQLTWARRNRMHGRVEFHHNLIRLFPPERYTKTHPRFFPIRKGTRFLPPDNGTHGWQPCFTADGIVDEAVANICRHFAEHPKATSYSLGVNDSSGHCECTRCQALDPEAKNFLGRRDVSDRYFAWCNQVVARVLEKYPDKWFGCLAYSEVAAPPSRGKVHARIIPFMTYDRMKWVHPELRATGEAMTRRWHAKSPVLGWYDYIYGWTYCVPRVWFHHMADYYRFGRANGVRALYAEAYPNWGEGPKLYVSLKLQWDPERDVDALLREWYVRTVGEDAADDLAAYYALWEDFWTRRILDSKWFTERGQYLRFHDPGYLADVTDEDIAKCRELLERVVARAKTPKQKARAGLLLLAFEYYEASAVTFNGSRKAQTMAVADEKAAMAALAEGERCLGAAARRQQIVAEVFPEHRYLVRPIDFDRYGAIRGEGWGSGLLWLAFDWAERSEAVRERIRELAKSPLEAISIPARTMLALLDKSSAPVSANPSFESADGKWPKEWSPWVKWGAGSMAVSPKAARTGRLGVLCRGMKRGGPHQNVAVSPGRYAAVASVRVPEGGKASARVTLSLTPLDEKGKNLTSLSTTVVVQAGPWRRLAVAGTIPAEIAGKAASKARLIAFIDGQEHQVVEELHIDDLAMYRIE